MPGRTAVSRTLDHRSLSGSVRRSNAVRPCVEALRDYIARYGKSEFRLCGEKECLFDHDSLKDKIRATIEKEDSGLALPLF